MADKIGFIGAGNMTEAIIKSVINAKVFAPSDIFISDINSERLNLLSKNYGLSMSADNCKLSEASDIIVLSVKPQNMSKVLDEIKPSVRQNSLVISIAAGVTIKKIAETLGDLAIVRVMPNTPAFIGEGAAGIYANKKAEAKINDVSNIFSALGEVVVVKSEGLIDAVTAVSGSGPAYFFLLAEEMIKAAMELGLNEKTAKQLVLQTAKGAALLAEAAGKAGQNLQQLRQNVTSPGGTTAAAIETFEQNGFARIVSDAVKAAAKRSKELSGS
ncbi:MAG: pyrroline-5-carboxylate reductase [Anaerohalosphaeraceae bacterium]|nr:pyrroline-5-carboxylate reductase [Anaerohalosphaeraceae bacterium]